MVSVMPKALGDANRDDATEKAAKKATEDLTVAEQGRMLRTGCLTVEQVSMNNAFGISAQCRAEGVQHERRQKVSADTQLLNLMDQLRDFEAQIVRDYGEDFAENLLEDQYAQGNVTDEERARILAIEDKEKRQQAVADLFAEKLKKGEITIDDIKDHEWAERWIRDRAEVKAGKLDLAHDVYKGKVSLDSSAVDTIVKDMVELMAAQNGKTIEDITDTKPVTHAEDLLSDSSRLNDLNSLIV